MSTKACLEEQCEFDEDGVIEQEVRLIEQAWDRAIRSCDLDSLTEMMADDYVVTNSRGDTADRSMILNLITVSEFTLDSTDRDITEVRVYGDTAIVIGRITWKAEVGESRQSRPSIGRQARYMKVYVKGRKGWQAVITQATQIEKCPDRYGALSILSR
ncbi:MAG: nuclear transport factor 2 family protein [Chloracidobacterium sp.]|nr:nuclear transport factor 2 family protein [Chloracidobacterium sp.]